MDSGVVQQPESEGTAAFAASRPMRLLRLLARTAVASNEAARVEDALTRVLADTCELLDWDVGHAWLLAGDGSGDFAPAGIWHPAVPPERFERLRLATAALRYRSSDGWVGGLLARPSPIWAIAEPETDAPASLRLASGECVEVGRLSRTRVPLALECGLRSFLLIPICARDEVVGALEVASARREVIDADLLEALEHVGIQSGGSGLGLSLAWGIARGHGGDLELASEPGRGTTVRLRLPAAAEEGRS